MILERQMTSRTRLVSLYGGLAELAPNHAVFARVHLLSSVRMRGMSGLIECVWTRSHGCTIQMTLTREVSTTICTSGKGCKNTRGLRIDQTRNNCCSGVMRYTAQKVRLMKLKRCKIETKTTVASLLVSLSR